MFKKQEIQALTHLQRQKQELDKELTLQQSQAQLTKDYVIRQGTYKVIITIYELNDLQPKSIKLWRLQLAEKSACNSFVQIQVNNQVKRTEIRQGTNNPIFDEQFYFQFDKMSISQLDRAKISFNVYDTRLWGHNQSMIGCFELDWTNVYFKRNHEIYRAWLTLYDPNNELDGPVGYLLASIAVLGQNDQITVHDSAFIKDPLVTIEQTITSPKVPLIDCSISIQIYRAQNLIPLDFISSQVKAYVIAKFSGNKVKTSNVKSLNPEWNECIKIGTQIPTKSKYITLEVRNKNLLMADDLIGVIKVPFVDVFENDDSKPVWGHLYGPPIAGKDVQPTCYATKMQVYGDRIGSHYRGRLLYKIVSRKDLFTKNIKNKLIFKFPYRIVPVIPLKLFMLRVDLIEGFGLPDLKFCHVQICLGQYTIKTNKFTMKQGFCEFYEMLEQKKVNLPQNPESMPDLVIYFCNGLNEENRIGFLRIKASEIFNNDPMFDEVKVYELKFDKSINPKESKSSCGFIACRLHLFNSAVSSPPRKKIVQRMKVKNEFEFRIFLYRGQNFPPANETGDCDPMIKFSFNEQKLQSKYVSETYNPIWNQVLASTVRVQNLFSTNMQKCLICDVFDHEQSEHHNYIGSFSVKINGTMRKKIKLSKRFNQETVEFIYSKPRWYHVVNPNVEVGNEIFGRVLIACALFKKKYQINGKEVLFTDLEKQCRLNQIKTATFNKNVNFYLIGIRQLKVNRQESLINAIKKAAERKLTQVIIKPEIRMNCPNALKQKQDSGNDFFRLKNNGCEINKVFRFKDVEVPKNKQLSTYAQFKITDQKGGYIYGSNSVNLKSFKNVFNDEQQTKVKDKLKENMDILDVEDLQIQLKKLNLLNKITKQNKLEEDTGRFVSKKALKIAGQEKLIPPQEIQNRSDSQNQDPQMAYEMQKLIKQFQQQFETKQGDINQYAYIKTMMGSSSNNSIQNFKNGPGYNFIDVQNKKFGLNKENKSMKEENQVDSQDEEDELIDEKKDKFDENLHIGLRENGINLYGYPQDSSKNLVSSEYRKPSSSSNRPGFKKSKTDFLQTKENYNTKTINPMSESLQSNAIHSSKVFNYGIQQQKSIERKSHIINFDLNQSLVLSQKQHTQKAIKFPQVQKGLQLQQQHMKQAFQRQHEYKYASAVKLSLFKWMRKEQPKQKQTYQDYDTDDQQNLDIIPEWYKGRKILGNDLEKLLENNRTIENVYIYRGRKIQGFQTRVKEKVGLVKMVVVSGDDKAELQSRAKYYQKLLRQKQFSCRIYVLKGKSLLTRNLEKPNTYLRFTYGDKVTEYKDKIVKTDNNPEYYMCHEQWIQLPGPSTIKIQVMEAVYLVGNIGDRFAKDRLIGYTEIDVEDRYFMKKWHLLERKPIQLRNLYSEYGIGTQGRLETWIDLIEKKKWFVEPVIKITPPPWDQFQLRVIVWSTKDCVFKNQELQSNDVYVRGQIGKSNYQETDVHWACRSVGNFNYRFKFPVFYPPKPQDMYSDVFTIQIWDKDVIGFDNLIGECRINLNSMHKIIQKAVKRKKPVVAVKKIIQKNMKSTERFWFDVFNHKQKDEFGQLQSQGKVQLSFELVPMEISKTQRSNGYGRSEPNVYPTLAEPSGRLNFNFLHPLDFAKQLLGPNLYRSLCIKCFLILLLVVIILLFVFFGTSILAGFIAKG